MNNEQKHLSSFKFYDEKKRRLSIFARETNDGHIEMFKITCSKKDQFCKKCGRDVYALYLTTNPENNEKSTPIQIKGITYHPVIYKVKIEEGNGPRYTFLHHLHTNYLKKFIRIIPTPVFTSIYTYRHLYLNNPPQSA